MVKNLEHNRTIMYDSLKIHLFANYFHIQICMRPCDVCRRLWRPEDNVRSPRAVDAASAAGSLQEWCAPFTPEPSLQPLNLIPTSHSRLQKIEEGIMNRN